MIGYTTEVDLKQRLVRTTFRKEVRTFSFNDSTFPLLEALKVASEDFVNQLCEMLQDALERAESRQ